MNLLQEAGEVFSTTVHDNNRERFIEDCSQLFDSKYSSSDGFEEIGPLFESEEETDRYRAATTIRALEKVKEHIEYQRSVLGEHVVQQSLGQLNQRVYDVVRMFYPNLIAHELCDIQTLDGQSGEIFRIKPIYQDTDGITFRNNFNTEVTGDDVELWRSHPDGFYTDRTAAQDSPLGRFTVGYALQNAAASTTQTLGVLPGADSQLVPTTGDGRDWLPMRPGTVQVTVRGQASATSDAALSNNLNVRFTDNGSGALTIDDDNSEGDATAQTGVSLINYATGAIRISLVAANALASGNRVSISVSFETASSREIDSKIRDQDNPREDGTLPRRVSFQLVNTPIKARFFPLRFDYSVPSQIAAEQHLNINVPEQLVEMAAQEVKVERDRRLIRKILDATNYHFGSSDTDAAGQANYAPGSFRTLEDSDLQNPVSNDGILGESWDAANPSGYSLGSRFNEFDTVIDTAEAYIQSNNGRGGVDWIVVGRNVANVVKRIDHFNSAGQKAPIGPHVTGTLRDGELTVVKDISMDPNDFVVGFKGYQAGDAAIIMAEWLPLYVTPPFYSPEHEVHQGIATAYELVTNNAGYFVKGRIRRYGQHGS